MTIRLALISPQNTFINIELLQDILNNLAYMYSNCLIKKLPNSLPGKAQQLSRSLYRGAVSEEVPWLLYRMYRHWERSVFGQISLHATAVRYWQTVRGQFGEEQNITLL